MEIKNNTYYAKSLTNKTPQPSHTTKKLHKKYLSSIYCGNILITPNNKATYKRRCRSMRLFHLHSALKIQTFYPVFPLTKSIAKIFCRFIPLKFQGIKHQPFPMAQPYKNPAAVPGNSRHSPIPLPQKMSSFPRLRWGIR